MFSISERGDLKNTMKFLTKALTNEPYENLKKYGERGVKALREATPKDSGITADSWSYEIIREKGSVSIRWNNSNINNGVPIAVILQYGHATRNGGWVEGRDYINPAVRPIFDEMAKEIWREATK